MKTIASANQCLTALGSRQRRALPSGLLGPSHDPDVPMSPSSEDRLWLDPLPGSVLVPVGGEDPADVVAARSSLRLALVASLQHLPPRQRAVLILCEVLRWKASEVAELLETSVASVNSALQRARATLEATDVSVAHTPASVDAADEELLARYVAAFEAYDIEALTSLIHEDASQSMPPFDLWLEGRDDIFKWWFGPGIACRGSRVLPTRSANGAPAFGQYKPSETGTGYEPWSLQVVELTPTGVGEITFFLDTQKLFPLFGLPLHLDS
jgi:RNA polymerase sigma-70 factor, ECF subfamily